MIYQVNDGTNRSINHDNEASSSTIYCNNASIIQCTSGSTKYDLKRKNSTGTSPVAGVQTVQPITTTRSSSSINKSGGNISSYVVAAGNGHTNTTNRTSNYHHKMHYDDRRNETNMRNDIISSNRRIQTANLNQYTNHSKRSSARSSSCQRNHTMHNSDSYSSKSSASYSSTCSASSCDGGSDTSSSSGEPNLPYPGFPEYSMRYLTQDTRPRNWCLLLITNPWFERVSILVIIFNCVTLGMYQPCVDDECVTNRCKILQVRLAQNHFILLFFRLIFPLHYSIFC